MTLRELTAVVLLSFTASIAFAQSPESVPEQKIEQEFLAVPSARLAGEHLKTLTAAPHLAASKEDYATAEYVAAKFKAAGLETSIVPYKVWLNVPREVKITATAPDGKVTTWMVEAGSPNVLLRRGFNKNTIPVGTKVIVDGYQSKDGSDRANGRDITLPNGQKLFLGSSGTGAPYDKK